MDTAGYTCVRECVCVYANKCLCVCVNNDLRTMSHNLKTNSADTRGVVEGREE